VAESVHEHLEHRLHRLDNFHVPQGQRKVTVPVVQHKMNKFKQCREAMVQIGVSHHRSCESVLHHLAQWNTVNGGAKQQHKVVS